MISVPGQPSRPRELIDREVAVVRAWLREVMESSHDAIIAKDLEGTVIAWNPAAVRLYGYTAAEIIGRPISLIIPPDSLVENERVFAEVVAGTKVAPHDVERLSKSGDRLAVSVAMSAIRDASGEVIGVSTVTRDLTGRREADGERAYSAMLVSQSANAILGLDVDGAITMLNPAAERLLGHASSEAVGHLIQEIIPTDARAAHAERATSIRTGFVGRYESQRKHRDGRVLTIETTIGPLYGPAGNITGAMTSMRDLSAARDGEVAAAQARGREAALVRELDQTRRLESVGQLAGGIAHDFNNLLGIIMNFSKFAADELPAGSAARADIDEVTRAAERAATLTRQLLIFSRRDVVKPEVLNIGAVIVGLENLLRRALGERVELVVHTAEDLWSTEVDRGQLEQVLVNLAVNGRDAMPDGGRLLLEARNAIIDSELSETRLGLPPGDYVTLTVSDSGTGMTPEVLDRAFQPFYTTKATGQGTGLGLSTVYGIITEAGGRVTLYSELGKGTSVKVHLPATTAAANPVPLTDTIAPRGNGERVLLVEDEADVRRMATRILTRAGYRVHGAAGGKEAEAIFDAEPIDLVLTDVIMPAQTGPELVRQLRLQRPELKVLFMSGYTHQMLTPEMLEDGASAFVEKPFTAEALQREIRALIDRPTIPT